MLTTRVLPPEEWDQLTEIEPFRSGGLPTRVDDWQVLVVERDGAIVGTCSLFNTVHWDCWWIDPASRGKGSVLAALLSHSLQLMGDAGLDSVYTGAEHGDTSVAELLVAFGFEPAPGRLFVLDVPLARERLKER